MPDVFYWGIFPFMFFLEILHTENDFSELCEDKSQHQILPHMSLDFLFIIWELSEEGCIASVS